MDRAPAPAIPDVVTAVGHRAAAQGLLRGHTVRVLCCVSICAQNPQVDQVTVNEYVPGVGFTAHVDTHSAFRGALLSLSLAGHTVMEFRRPGCAPRALLLPARSLLVMADEARLAWYDRTMSCLYIVQIDQRTSQVSLHSTSQV